MLDMWNVPSGSRHATAIAGPQWLQLGDHLDRERIVHVHLTAPSDASADIAVAELVAARLDVAAVVRRDDPREEGPVGIMASRVMTLVETDIARLRSDLERVAERSGGQIDGWGCLPVVDAYDEKPEGMRPAQPDRN
jgi:hypothetical protein